MDNCVFCNYKEVLFKNDLAVAFFDGFPVSKGHTLIISKRLLIIFFLCYNFNRK